MTSNETMSDDMTLVREYAQSHSEQAFATLVSRHINLVYSVALRQCRDPHLSEEITQGVLILLAQKARTLAPNTILSGWLCRTARYISADTLKIQRRRQFREQEAHMQSTLNESDSATWNQIEPLLDEALGCLGEKEHDAVVLRFFDGKELRQVGAALGTTEDAARMQINRAIEKLRKFFTKRGVTLSATAITGAVAANSVHAAPVGLAVSISAAVFSATTTTTAAVIAATKTTAMTMLQKTIIAATVAVLAGAGIYETSQAVQLRGQNQRLQQQQAPLAEEIQRLQRERDAASNRLVSMTQEIATLNANNLELLRLRGEFGRLQQRTSAMSNEVAKAYNYGLLPDQMPPVTSTSVPETAQAYARLAKKMATGQLSAAEEFNLLKAWPYLEKRFSEPDGFGFFQSEYLAALLDLKGDAIKWQLRQILEQARNEEHAHGLKWARMTEAQLQRTGLQLDMQQIRDDWNALNETTTQKIVQVLPEDQRSQFTGNWQILDFEPELKSGTKASLSDPRFQNFGPRELFQAFFPSVYYSPTSRAAN